MTRADQRKHHYIYKITRVDGSGKYYIGMHSTDDLDDGYFGSGTYLWHSINKHGKDAHSKEILEHLPSRKDLKLREKEIVNEELLGDPLCMNLKCGGEGNSSEDSKRIWLKPGMREQMTASIKAAHSTPEARARSSKNTKALWETEEFRKKMAENNQPVRQEARWQEGSHEKQAAILKAKWEDPGYKATAKKNISIATKSALASMPNPWVGKTHSEEAKRKMSLAASNRKRAPMSQETKDRISQARRKK